MSQPPTWQFVDKALYWFRKLLRFVVSNIHSAVCQPTKPILQATGLLTHDPYFSQIPLFNGLSILLIIPKRESRVGNNLSLLILCT